MKVKTSEATGKVLDWLVELALGTHWSSNGYFCYAPHQARYPFNSKPLHSYSTDWLQGGPIIDKYDIDVLRDDEAGVFGARLGMMAKHPTRNVMSWFSVRGPTKLIAAMRCFVASKLGDEVEVPQELMA